LGTLANVYSTSINKKTDYVGNIIYENDNLKRILVDGGYWEDEEYHFFLTDHLGNNRVVVKADGTTIVQKSDYYPFGMSIADNTGSEAQPYKYNGKELDQMHGLNTYDYHARQQDFQTGRFTSVDPLAEKYYSWNPYAYCANNPIKYIDPTGMDWWSTNDQDEIERVLEILKSGKKIDSDMLGDNWTRVTDQELAKGMGVFDDASYSFTIDGVSFTEYKGFGLKDGFSLTSDMFSLGSSVIWGHYSSNMKLTQSGKFSYIYNGLNYTAKLGFYGNQYISASAIASQKAAFLSGAKLGGYAKLGGSVLSYVGAFSSGYNLYTAIDSGDEVETFKSSVDAVFLAVAFAGPWGAGISATWFVTEPLRDIYAIKVVAPYLEATNGIIYPAFVGK
jgi:RHS repeat-associated protein